MLLLLLLSPGLRGDSRWRVLLVPTRALATAILFWLALLPPGLAKAALPGNVTLWHYHLDHLGSTHSITDASGNLYRQTRTTTYGEVRGRYDGSGNIVAAEVALRHEFTGYQSEEKSGLQYAGARYYLPELGVLTSHDPAGQFPNPYAYGGGDPVNGTDPDGSLFWLVATFAFLTGATFAAGRAIYAGIKTGNWGAAFKQFGIELGIARATSLVGAGIAAGLEKLGSEELAMTYLVAQTGYTAYNFAQSIRRGDTLGAVTAGLSLVATAYGFVEDQFGSNTSKVVSGQGKEAKQTGQAAQPREGPLDSSTTFEHYREGSGEPLRMSFHDIDTSEVRPSQFEMVQEELGQGARDAVLSIDDQMTFSTSGDQAWFLGDISLRLEGQLVVRKSGTFKFTATLKSFDDRYDFNKRDRG